MEAIQSGQHKIRALRIQNEVKELKEGYFNILEIQSDFLKMIVIGPKGTPYIEGRFILKIEFPSDYPMTYPKLTFETPIFHPNVNKKGNVCMSILGGKWDASITITKVIQHLMLLLQDPMINNPYQEEATKLYNEDYTLFFRTALKKTMKDAYKN